MPEGKKQVSKATNWTRSCKYSIVAHEWTVVAADSLRQLAGIGLRLQWRPRLLLQRQRASSVQVLSVPFGRDWGNVYR
jgi:hypothetical protein